MNEPVIEADNGERQPRLAPAPCSASWHLFKHMSDNHGLTLLESEMDDICQVVDEMRMKKSDSVTWILINALRHLDNDQMQTLLDEIAKRTKTPNEKS